MEYQINVQQPIRDFVVGNTKNSLFSNMEEKMIDKEFLDNIFIILKQDVEYDNKRAWDNIKVNLVEKIQLIYINSFF